MRFRISQILSLSLLFLELIQDSIENPIISSNGVSLRNYFQSHALPFYEYGIPMESSQISEKADQQDSAESQKKANDNESYQNSVTTPTPRTILDPSKPIPLKHYGPYSQNTNSRSVEMATNGYAQAYSNFIPIVNLYHKIQPDVGQYDFAFESANGIRQQESGYMRPIGTYIDAYGYENHPQYSYDAELATVKEGSVSWISPEGFTFSFSYVADNFGYRAYGAHIQAVAPEPLQHQLTDSYNNPTSYDEQSAGVIKVQI